MFPDASSLPPVSLGSRGVKVHKEGWVNVVKGWRKGRRSVKEVEGRVIIDVERWKDA